MAKNDAAGGFGRRQFLGGAGALAFGGWTSAKLLAQPQPTTDLVLVNGKIHTMDPANRVVSQALMQAGRFTAVSNNVSVPRGAKRIDLKWKTEIPGLIEAHNHNVLVVNRPGLHTPL